MRAPFLACDFACYEHVHSSDLRCLSQLWLFRLNAGYHNVENRASHLQRMTGFCPITSQAWRSNPYSLKRSPCTSTSARALRPPLLGFACRRGERPFGPSRIRPCGLTAASRLASRFARLASASLPSRSAGLRSGLFWPEAKTIPPLHPSPASGRAVCLLGSGKPTVKKHTHECGSISSGWPPNQPASRIAKLFGEGRVCGMGRSRA